MPGLVAVFSEQETPVDLDPLIKRISFRGGCRKKEPPGDRCGMAVLDQQSSQGAQTIPAALDGFLVLQGEETVQQGNAGEKKLCRLFEQEGPGCLHDLEGEFTLAYNADDDFMAARDPFGVKPLYYSQKEGALYLAPEIKAFLDLNTPVKEVPPGYYYDHRRGWVRYFKPPGVTAGCALNLRQAEVRLRRMLRGAVRDRITGVDDFGVYLSGGLDSSVIAYLAAELTPQPPATFTVGVEGSSDVEYARLVSERINSHHHEYIYNLDEMLAVLPAVIYHLESFDCAYVRSAIPNYIAARQAAAAGRKVMLSGEGSDELFAGYSYLKNLGSSQEVRAETAGLINNLSNTGLQRVDRMNAAHGLECRVPFLKPALVELSQQLPVDWVLHGPDNDPVDKYILRRAFTAQLGRDVAWREKQQFDQGSGSAEKLAAVAAAEISDAEYNKEAAEAPVPVRNKEELYYYRIFRRFFPESVLPLVGRWSKTS